MKYETICEDWHGHMTRDRFEANSDEEAIKIVKCSSYGFKMYSSGDCLWRVNGEYINYSCGGPETQYTDPKYDYVEIFVVN